MREIIYRATATLEGITPLLMHKCGIIDNNNNIRTATTDYSEEWKKTVYKNADNVLIVPSINLEAMLLASSKGIKIGKNYLSKITSSGIYVDDFEHPIYVNNKIAEVQNIEENQWLFACSVVIGKQRVTRVRAAIPIGWTIKVNLSIINPLINHNILKGLIEKAGYEVGLMDWRPGSPKPGKFGQFQIKEITFE